jgi:hypothetical protein
LAASGSPIKNCETAQQRQQLSLQRVIANQASSNSRQVFPLLEGR